MLASYLIIPLFTLIFVLVQIVMIKTCDAWNWYQTLNFPALMPTFQQLALVLAVLFSLATIALVIIWNGFERNLQFWALIGLFCLLAFLNIMWTYLFFVQHNLWIAFLQVIAIQFVLVLLTGMIASRSFFVSLLMMPYALWGFYDIYWSYMMWMLN